jgi:predicted Zn finger-like uncharacterized protein
MTLATRCPACGTVFRVVDDQLRVSDGWVRCGRCSEVFNAVEHIVDAATAGLAVTAPARDATAPPRAQVPPARMTFRTAPADAPAAPGAPPAPPPRPAAPPAPMAPPEDTSVPALPDLIADPGDRLGDAAAAIAAVQAGHAVPLSADTGPAPLPGFLRRAERDARWRQPKVRAALVVLGVAAALALAAQALLAWRDTAAARWPALAPVLQQACATLGCTLQPPRAIEALAVDSSSLVRVERSDVYRLSVALRSRAGMAVAMPALDLTLTDTRGEVIARRVMQPTEFEGAVASIPASGEAVLQGTLRVGGAAVAGYTIEVFYP